MHMLGEKLVAAGHRIPPRPPPKNGRAYHAWLTGGWDSVIHKVKPLLHRDYGIEVIDHWPQDGVAKIPTREPVGTELVLYSIDVSSHNLADRAREIARRAGIPYIPLNLNMKSRWPEIFAQHGFLSPPPWRKATLVAVPPQPIVYEDDPMPKRTRKHSDTAMCKAIGRLRKTAGLSQQDYAEMVGTSQPTWGSWERGDTRPFYRFFRALADLSPEILDMLPDAEPFKGRYLKDPERKQRLPQPAKPEGPLTPEQRERLKASMAAIKPEDPPQADPMEAVIHTEATQVRAANTIKVPPQGDAPAVNVTTVNLSDLTGPSQQPMRFEETRGKFEALTSTALVLEEAPPKPIDLPIDLPQGWISSAAKLADSVADMGIEALGAAYGRQMRVVESARAALRAEEAKATELHARLIAAASR